FLGRANLEVGYPNGTATPGLVKFKGPLMLIVSPGMLAVPVVLFVLIVGGLYWRRMRHRLAEAHEALARVPVGAGVAAASGSGGAAMVPAKPRGRKRKRRH